VKLHELGEQLQQHDAAITSWKAAYQRDAKKPFSMALCAAAPTPAQ
jgi:hypothetical protein